MLSLFISESIYSGTSFSKEKRTNLYEDTWAGEEHSCGPLCLSKCSYMD